jgi:hypothetical protein
MVRLACPYADRNSRAKSMRLFASLHPIGPEPRKNLGTVLVKPAYYAPRSRV